MKCDKCNKQITWKEFRYSTSTMKKALCVSCQKEERLKTMPVRMAKFLNEMVDKRFSQERKDRINNSVRSQGM